MGDAADDAMLYLEGRFIYGRKQRRKKMKNEEHYICCEVEYKAHTDKAVLVAQHGNEIWVPRSCLPWRTDRMIDGLSRGEIWQMHVASWFAQQNELEGD